MKRLLLLSLGWICVALGAAGVLLPLLPTTPFLIVAAWAFARSSRHFADWLHNHVHFGPLLRDWDSHRVIPLPAKLLSTTFMTASLLYLWLGTDVATPHLLSALVVLVLVSGYIWSKPHRRPPGSDRP
ncbi:MAG: YbaN family protein [Candidatus Competibacteraceae bacterium]|nr:YbaN family protein [Candidatus Competibacteraceae bacterium]